jgi:hypothetical protein
MELNIDLLKKRKTSLWLIIPGSLLLCFLIFILVWRHLLPYALNVPILDNTSYSLLFISGTVLIIAGSGDTLVKILGKAFIMIDDESISIKNDPLKPMA